MRPESGAAGTPQEWIRRAHSNVIRAKQPRPADVLWEDLCFDAQQAAEKALKAALIQRQTDFPKTHNIRALLTLLDSARQRVPEEIWQTTDLSVYATAARYPGDAEPVTKDEYRRAVALAEAVVRWAEGLVAAGRR